MGQINVQQLNANDIISQTYGSRNYMHFGIWSRQSAEVQTEHQNGEER